MWTHNEEWGISDKDDNNNHPLQCARAFTKQLCTYQVVCALGNSVNWEGRGDFISLFKVQGK